MEVVVHVDGGARGNPGPAAAAAIVSTPAGEVLDEAAETLDWGTATYAFPAQDVPPQQGQLWRYRYVRTIPPA